MIILIFAGALGAFFSSLMRLYDFADLPKALVEPGLGQLPSGYLIIYSLVPSVIGAIAATVLYITFAAGLLEGALFPRFACKLMDESGKVLLVPEACRTLRKRRSRRLRSGNTRPTTPRRSSGPSSPASRSAWCPTHLQTFAAKVENAEQEPKTE